MASEQGPSPRRRSRRKSQGGVHSRASSASRRDAPPAAPGFATGEDYIAFDFEEEEDGEEDEVVVEDRSPAKGKGREYAQPSWDAPTARKRSADEMEREGDGYANKKERTDAASRLTPWAADVDWDSCRNLAEMMHEEVKAFVMYIAPTDDEHDVRTMIIALIARAIQRTWPDARVLPFGSYETKLYLPLGDIDLVVESRVMENFDKRRLLYTLASVLRKANITDNVQVIAKAKVPIIKFVTSHGRFSVDISVNQGNGVKAGRIVNRLLKELPALQPLVMVIKLFLSQRSMNEVYTGGLGSYAIVCMAVSFLQMHPKIRGGEIDPSKNLGVLVLEFFELYGHYFNYDNTGISLRDGGTYFKKSARGWDDPRHPSLLSIEDPIDISNDISKNSYNITRVRKTLAGAHEVLTAVALTRGRILMAKANGKYTNLRDRRRSEDGQNQSILGSVMGVTRETLNHRRMVRRLHAANTLQNLLGLPRCQQASVDDGKVPLSDRDAEALRRRSAKAVESAWGEADAEDELDHYPGRREPEREEREESRYSAGVRSYPRKRRRVAKFPETQFVAESEEEEGEGRSHNLSRSRARRAYWASKGMTGGEGSDESDWM